MLSRMLKQELQTYFDRVFPYSRINEEHTLGGQVYIQYELGGDKENGTIERVTQSVERALTIFNDTFNQISNKIFVVIYEYQGANIFGATNEYLYKQFPTDRFAKFYNQLETIGPQYTTTDEYGNKILEQEKVKIIIGKLPVESIDIENILTAIANTEMGFKPAIEQRVFFTTH